MLRQILVVNKWCFGGSSGSINLTVSGGTSPCRCWSNTYALGGCYRTC
ncbi:MAG: SprB repeat-containing protein [Bacteroidetes bacterium]|nr:SprB repeat-containing protein [Bacteroidota bacterium]